MFSGIRDFLRMTRPAADTKHQAVQPRRDEEPRGPRDDAPPADDDTLFSIAAIRALLTTEPLPDDLAAVLHEDEKQKILQGLAALEAQGIHNIPLRLGQSLLDAVRAALPPG
jgi:hypothetical protein